MADLDRHRIDNLLVLLEHAGHILHDIELLTLALATRINLAAKYLLQVKVVVLAEELREAQ